jgi:hypothetical protein
MAIQSKHLETVVVHVMGKAMDVVQLRAETYQPGSRIPTAVAPASPASDAFRRDFTINALFYNLLSHSLEDFTNKVRVCFYTHHAFCTLRHTHTHTHTQREREREREPKT